ncbi:wax ester/triacylglycerol synthase domain-containing protein [Actinomadura sp. 3N508]|uniref:wax ester/triacylglycerol synthase domain-containing protein n=1 Tax=Actinomadura sp. 3N508 TaxID=3375153 RepID=UPI0037BCAD72
MDSVPANCGDRFMLLLSPMDEENCNIGAAIRFNGPLPAHDHFRQLANAAIAAVPALRYRLTGPLPTAQWTPLEELDPDRHIEYHRIPPGANLYDAVMRARCTLLPKDQPLWRAHIIHGYSTDEYTLCYQAHHAFQDGMSAVATLRATLTGRPLQPPTLTRHPGRSTLCGALRTLAAQRPYPTDPRWRPPATTTNIPLLDVADLDPNILHEVAERTGSTIAHVTLAAVAGALHDWNPTRQGKPRDWRRRNIYLSVPTGFGNGRRNGALGNHSCIVSLTLPGGDPSPYRRLQAIREGLTLQHIVHARRNQAFIERLGFLPALIAASALAFAAPLVAPGLVTFTMLPTQTIDIPGAIDLFAVPPLPFHAGADFIALHTSTGVNVACAMNADLPDVGQIPTLIQHALDELHSALGG